ncbi:MAG: hypothetical protein R3B06_08145 [Kofleriaceae bacterium]
MRARWLWFGVVVVAVACKRSGPRAAAGHDAGVGDAGPGATPTVPGAATAPGPITPAVTGRGVQLIDLEYGGFTAIGLPAMRDDGGQLAVVAQADDGGRGYLDLTARILDGATGAVIRELRLADADATSAAITDDDEHPDGTAVAALERRAAATVAELNQLVAGPWHPLVATRRPPADPAPREVIAVDDLTFTFVVADRQLVVERAGNVVAVQATGTPAPAPPAHGDAPCAGDQPTLAAIYRDVATGRALVQFDYQAGGHNCGAGPSTFVVVALPR